MGAGMHPQTRSQLMQQQRMNQQQSQYANMMYNPNPSMMMTQQALPPVGMRRPASEMNGGLPHPNEPPGKRYRKVISNVSCRTHADHSTINLSRFSSMCHYCLAKWRTSICCYVSVLPITPMHCA